MQGYRIITKKEFYDIINPLDICVNSDLKEYPEKHMLTKFTYRNGTILGLSTHNYNLDSENYGEQIYYIVENHPIW